MYWGGGGGSGWDIKWGSGEKRNEGGGKHRDIEQSFRDEEKEVK